MSNIALQNALLRLSHRDKHDSIAKSASGFVVANKNVQPKSNLNAWRALVLAALFSFGLGSTATAQNLPDTIERSNKVAESRDHDIAVLKITGRPLTAMVLGDSNRVRERETFAITGFPIGMVLGLNAVTHRAMIAAVTPIVIPQLSGQNLERKALTRLTAPYTVFQLDATAYPGNSGSLSCRKRPGRGHHKQSFHLRNQGVRAPEAEWNHLQDLLKKIRIE